MARLSISASQELGYERQGAGRPVVLLHSLCESRESWRPVVDLLNSHFDVLALDLPGHGESSPTKTVELSAVAVDIKVLLERLRIERPLLVGHGFGALVACAVAPKRMPRGVVAVDSLLSLRALKTQLAPLLNGLTGKANDRQRALGSYLTGIAGPKLSPAQHDKLLAALSAQQAMAAAAKTYFSADDAALDTQSVALVKGLSPPLHALFGTEPDATALSALKSAIPAATTEVWPEHGHYLHWVNPIRFVSRLRELDRPLLA